MKRIVCFVLCCAFALFACSASAEEGFGLRVIADNDSEQAQARKTDVRDAVLAALWPRFEMCTANPERERLLRGFMPDALAIARQNGGARVEMSGRAPDGTPCVTLTITLGAGAGRNWFGILCPEVMEGLGEDDELKWRSADILRLWLLVALPAS